MAEGERAPEAPGAAPASKAAGLYAALVAVGKRITALIAGFSGRPNKETKKLTRELEEILERWED